MPRSNQKHYFSSKKKELTHEQRAKFDPVLQNPFELESSYDDGADEDEALEYMQSRVGAFRGAYLRSQGVEYPRKRGLFKVPCGTQKPSSG